MKNIFPVFIENSALPVVLSRVSPINIWAISIGPFVWCKGTLNETDKIHETIHYQQQLELLFVGQWILYFIFWVIGLFRYRDGAVAYMMIPFEKEAYSNEENLEYLSQRKSYSWVKYVGREKA